MQGTLRLRGDPIGALALESKIGRGTRAGGSKLRASRPGLGFEAIIKEVSVYRDVDIVSPAEARNYKTLLWSIPSPVEIERMELSRYSKPAGQIIIAGGMCALNPWAAYDKIDAMIFGRAEGQIMAILDGLETDNVWRKSKDPRVEGQYSIRQAVELIDGETQIGCRYKCKFCQYTWIRQQQVLSKGYDANMKSTPEDHWRDLVVASSGRYTTAWDGFSEQTRLAVGKKITDEDIIQKIRAMQSLDLSAAIVLKIYMIVGYPWETEKTVLRDIYELRQLLSAADTGKGGRVVIMFIVTPFSPEPLTPMQSMAISMINWRGVINEAGRALYWAEKLEAFILPQIAGPETLKKRIETNRAGRTGKGGIGEWVGYSHLKSYMEIPCMTIEDTEGSDGRI